MADLVNKERSLTSDEFHDFEIKFRRKVPDSFRSHYMVDNGGFPDEDDVEAGKWGLPVNGFNPIKYGKLTIEKLVDECGEIVPVDNKFGFWVKFSFIPFAYDSGGNPIFISLRDNDYSSVYLYAQDGGNIFMIAPSFDAFRMKLYMTANQ